MGHDLSVRLALGLSGTFGIRIQLVQSHTLRYGPVELGELPESGAAAVGDAESQWARALLSATRSSAFAALRPASHVASHTRQAKATKAAQ